MPTETEVFTEPTDAGTGEAGLIRLWENEISLARNREKDYRKDGQKTIDRYLSENNTASDSSLSNNKPIFNILWSNTEVLKPALYFKTPKADVRTRNKDFRDPQKVKVLKDVSTILERGIDYSLDTYDFDETLETVVSDYVLPGRGTARVRYVPDIGLDEGGEETLRGEKAITERVYWKDFAHGPGRMWSEVEWVAFQHRMKKEEADEMFGEKARGLQFSTDAKDEQGDGEEEDQKSLFKKIEVWEVWDKPNRRIIFLTFDNNKRVLSVDDDTLNLDEFFPCPRPILSVPDNDTLVPRPEYMQYADLAAELDEVTNRIQKITRAVKFGGLYDGALGDDVDLFSQIGDNELRPTTNHIPITQGGGLSSHIHYLPTEQAATILQGLYARRQDIIQTIFEVTGISDVLRGSSDPRETAKAQSLKAQFGTQRLAKRQKDIQRFARDLIRLQAEIIATKFEPETLMFMTGVQPTEEIMAVLRNDTLLSFRIDIESDSTVLEDTERLQQNMADFTGSLSNLMNALAPGVQSGDIPKDVAADLLKAMVRNFKLGRIAEDALDRLTEPKLDEQGNPVQEQEPPSPEELEAQAKQAEMQMKAQEAQADNQIQQAELQLKSRELDIKEQELALKQQEAGAKAQIDQGKLQIDEGKLQLDAKTARQQEFSDVTGLPVETDQMEEEVAQMFQALTQALQAISQSQQQAAETQAQNTQMLGALLESQSAPKRIIKDDQGRPVGIETVQPTIQ